MVAALVSLFALTSCEKEPADLLIGKWNLTLTKMKSESMTVEITPEQMGFAKLSYTFKADGTLFTEQISEDGTSESVTASYEVLEGDNKTVINMTLEGKMVSSDVLQLDSNNLVLLQKGNDEGTVTLTFYFTRG